MADRLGRRPLALFSSAPGQSGPRCRVGRAGYVNDLSALPLDLRELLVLATHGRPVPSRRSIASPVGGFGGAADRGLVRAGLVGPVDQ